MVLFVDDDESILEFLRLLANQFDLPYRAVLSAKEALRLCKEGHDFDVIITDLDMPEMDRIQFAAALRQLGSDARLFSFSAGNINYKHIDLKSIFDKTFSKPAGYQPLLVEAMIAMSNRRYRSSTCKTTQ